MKEITHLAVGFDEALCGGKRGQTSDLPGLLKLDDDEYICHDCLKRIFKITKQLETQTNCHLNSA